MSRRHSTGALSPTRRQEQEARYASRPNYDVLIVGTGMAALSLGALLAHSGRKVCLLEAHDRAGGYVHTFQMGEYQFCAQIHYIWGCGKGDKIWRFLEKLNLLDDIQFELLDPDGYDRVVLPDGKQIRIPYGFQKLASNITAHYPDQARGLARFCDILERLTREVQQLPPGMSLWQTVTQGWKFLTLARYFRKTLQDVFEECGLRPEVQAVLIANSGNFMCPPAELSILAYNGLFSGYNRGAYYPRKHFRHFIDRLTQSIVEHSGCDFYFEEEVVSYQLAGNEIRNVTTRSGKVFQAPIIVCNADPQRTAATIGWEHVPPSWQKSLRYDYSRTALTVYLGLKGLDLREYGFGRFNTWHLEQWDLNQTWKQALEQNWERPWMFLATPTLHTPEGGNSPADGQVLELATAANYDYFRQLKNGDPAAYVAEKKALRDRLLDLVERHYVPDLRKHLKLRVTGSPTTNEDFCWAPRGHAYGQHLTPKNMGLARLRSRTPWKNFYWCNAASGYPGVNGTIGTGMQLYMDLTGDRFFDPRRIPDTETLHRQLGLSPS